MAADRESVVSVLSDPYDKLVLWSAKVVTDSVGFVNIKPASDDDDVSDMPLGNEKMAIVLLGMTEESVASAYTTCGVIVYCDDCEKTSTDKVWLFIFDSVCVTSASRLASSGTELERSVVMTDVIPVLLTSPDAVISLAESCLTMTVLDCSAEVGSVIRIIAIVDERGSIIDVGANRLSADAELSRDIKFVAV